MGGVGGNVDREKHPVNSEVCVLFSCTTFVALTPALFFFKTLAVLGLCYGGLFSSFGTQA